MSDASGSLFAGEFYREFAATDTDEERFNLTYNNLSQRNLLPFQNEFNIQCGKSVSESVLWRTMGNELLATDNDGALECYTKSIRAAPYPLSKRDSSLELALAFSNRSVCYMRDKKYEAAIKDIELAFKFKYPDRLKGKVLQRRAECYEKMGKPIDVAANLLHAVDLKENGNVTTNNAGQHSQEDYVPDEKKATLDKTFGQHKDIPAASDCLEIRYSPKFGRHLVSTRDIKPGDILVVEKPYVSVLLPSKYCTHCYNCMKRSEGMIPCQHCTLVMFCSEQCRNTSWQEFHKAECSILYFILHITENNEIMHIAFKTWIATYVESGGIRELYKTVCSLEDDIPDDPSKKGFNHDGQYKSSDYGATHFLGCHFAEAMTNLVAVFAQSAVVFINCIEHASSLLDVARAEGDPDWRAFAGVLMMRHMRIATFNSFRIDECYSKKTIFEGGMMKEGIGGGVYNLLSLCNHACWPNAARIYCDGNTKVLFAQLPIKKGEQIFIRYAGDFKTMSREERRVNTQELFHFTCHCAACTDNWPLYEEMTTADPKMLCPRCHAPLQRKNRKRYMECPACKHRDSAENVGLRLGAILAEMGSEEYQMYLTTRPEMDVISRIAKLLEQLYGCVAMPFPVTIDCQDLIGKTLYKHVGNYSIL